VGVAVSPAVEVEEAVAAAGKPLKEQQELGSYGSHGREFN
jgi:hypothetical protein